MVYTIPKVLPTYKVGSKKDQSSSSHPSTVHKKLFGKEIVCTTVLLTT